MITLRPSAAHGRTKIDWLDSFHSFSFGDYYDPNHMGFSDLRVINEDWITPGAGFPTHPHRDMEIVTIMLEGALAHKDSLGTGSTIRVGDVQKMSAGTGIRHSEFNASQTEPAHLLQIWVMPQEKGIDPGYQQKAFPEEARERRWQLIASPDGAAGSIRMHQDVKMYLGRPSHSPLSFEIANGRVAYAHVVKGEAKCRQHNLKAGDALLIQDEKSVEFTAQGNAEILFFDLAL